LVLFHDEIDVTYVINYPRESVTASLAVANDVK